MSIISEGSAYLLVCDSCGETDGHNYYEFRDAVEGKKDGGWQSRKFKGDWEDWCPECVADARKAADSR